MGERVQVCQFSGLVLKPGDEGDKCLTHCLPTLESLPTQGFQQNQPHLQDLQDNSGKCILFPS